MIYLLKASAILFIFYVVYKILLQKETFFQLNRIFLLIGFISALTIPLLNVPVLVEQTFMNAQNLTLGKLSEIAIVTKSIDWIQILKYVYICGVILFCIKFLIAIYSLRKLIKLGVKEKIDHFYHVKSTKNTLPFSYFKYIVYNPTQFETNELEQIIRHEQVHVSQHHSMDVQIAQFFSILFWFNPIVWLYKKEVQQNLEFIADSVSQRSTINNNKYQQLLLKLSLPNYRMALTNNFYTSLIKKRIIMLQKNKSRKINKLKPVLVLPFLALFIFSFNTVTVAQNTSTVVVNKSQDRIIKGKVTDVDGNPITRSSIIIKGTQRGASTNVNGEYALKADEGNLLVFSKLGMHTQEVMVDKTNEINVALQVDKSAPLSVTSVKIGPLYVVDGVIKTSLEMKDLSHDKFYSMTVLKDKESIKTYGEKGKNGVIIIATKMEKE